MSDIRYLSVEQVERLHALVIARSGGSDGLRERGTLESAVAQPAQTFGGDDLYPTLHEKAATLAYALVMGHPFVDGNKRIGHAAMETFLVLNGFEIDADVDEQERLFLDLAAGLVERETLAGWVEAHTVARAGTP
ncbi:MAG: type II toxin-antitoxin system death-on-curing family toxin [Bacteroidota bacterium]